MPANKRVEMLRNCEVDLRREPSKTQNKSGAEQGNANNVFRNESSETIPMPNSPVKKPYPKCNGVRFSPRKTHLTNFINQNITPVDLLRRQHADESATTISVSFPMEQYETKMKRSPCLQFNTNMSDNRKKLMPPKSPMPRRRFRSQSPHARIEETDSDSDIINANNKTDSASKKLNSTEYSGNGINGVNDYKMDQQWRNSQLRTDDIINQNSIAIPSVGTVPHNIRDDRPFRSVDMTHRFAENYYCPQSEPVKRKIYSEKILDSLQRSFDMESGRLFDILLPKHDARICILYRNFFKSFE